MCDRVYELRRSCAESRIMFFNTFLVVLMYFFIFFLRKTLVFFVLREIGIGFPDCVKSCGGVHALAVWLCRAPRVCSSTYPRHQRHRDRPFDDSFLLEKKNLLTRNVGRKKRSTTEVR